MKTEIIEKLKKEKIIQKGNFILKSGKTSNYYANLKSIYKNPNLTNKICEEIIKIMKDKNLKPNSLAASGNGGIPLATIVSNKTNIPLTLVRDRPKDHGIKSNIDGYFPKKEDLILIIDDIFASGTSIRQTIKNLKETNSKILGAIIVIHRQEGKINIPLYHLIKLEELK